MLLSVATTVMMALILFIFNIIIVLNILTQSSIQSVNAKVDLILYLSTAISDLQVNDMIADIKSIPVVTFVEYTSAENALREFLSMYPEKSDPFTNFGIENPLPGSLKVTTQKPDQQSLVVDYIKNSKFSNMLLDVESANENEEIISRLVKVTNFTQKLIIGVIVTFVFGSLLIIINAIHLSIFSRKREIQIMQLVGANQSMISFPFIFEGAIYSFIAVLFSFILLIIFVEGSHLMAFSSFNESFKPFTIFCLELVISLVIGTLSSQIAMTYYLKRTLVLESS